MFGRASQALFFYVQKRLQIFSFGAAEQVVD